jgi:class 3 adenylate cyclase/pimeloyl-ACP methyl ester carboxylesterase
MTEPRIQYVTTSDGVSIAYAVVGDGPPMVRVPTLPVSHLRLVWQAEFARETFGGLSNDRTYVSYDARGFGLSERNVTDFSLDKLVLDLEAVVDHLGFAKFQMMTAGIAIPVALAYAAAHTDRVSHLVLSAYASAENVPNEEIDAILALGEKNWELATETLTHAVLGWSSDPIAHEVAAIMRASATPETLRSFIQQIRTWRVADLPPLIEAPTLVIARTGGPSRSFDAARDLAASIPNAHLSMIDGHLDAANAQETAAIWSFLHGGQELIHPAAEVPHTTLSILFTDIVDSTSLTERLGDAAFRERAHQLDAALRAIIREGGGTAVEGKVLGDGVMAVFTSARQAIDAARRCRDSAVEFGLELHLGIHAGDVIRDGNNVYGGAVNIAARIAAQSSAGEILVSDVVRGLARTSAGVGFDDRDEHTLKGITDPVRLYAIHDA